MKINIQKWGNSLALRIPKSFAVEARIERGSAVDVSFKNGKIIATPITGKKYKLDDLLSKVNENNIHKEYNTGEVVGKEIW